jgi:hypothetical protein
VIDGSWFGVMGTRWPHPRRCDATILN